jgi:hypothetical protein
VAIVADLANLWLQQAFVQSLVHASVPQAVLPRAALLGGAVTTGQLLAGLVTVLAGVLMAWVIRRLMSPKVRQEFVA